MDARLIGYCALRPNWICHSLISHGYHDKSIHGILTLLPNINRARARLLLTHCMRRTKYSSFLTRTRVRCPFRPKRSSISGTLNKGCIAYHEAFIYSPEFLLIFYMKNNLQLQHMSATLHGKKNGSDEYFVLRIQRLVTAKRLRMQWVKLSNAHNINKNTSTLFK